MSRVLTFSRTFPTYHPRAGHETFFVEKILLALIEIGHISIGRAVELGRELGCAKQMQDLYELRKIEIPPKLHTIRANRKDGILWKPGDIFSPRVWAGKPYNSPQIIIAPDIEVKQVWDFEIRPNGKHADYFIDGKQIIDGPLFTKLCSNDGLSNDDLEDWFRYKAAKCQIICWSDTLTY